MIKILLITSILIALPGMLFAASLDDKYADVVFSSRIYSLNNSSSIYWGTDTPRSYAYSTYPTYTNYATTVADISI